METKSKEKIIRVGIYHAEIQEIDEKLFVKIIEYPKCTAVFRKDELPNIQDAMRTILVKYRAEIGQTGLKHFDAAVRRRLAKGRAKRRKEQLH